MSHMSIKDLPVLSITIKRLMDSNVLWGETPSDLAAALWQVKYSLNMCNRCHRCGTCPLNLEQIKLSKHLIIIV